MLTKENISVEDETIRMLKHGDTSDYSENIDELYNLIIEFNKKYDISSLEQVIIKDVDFFSERKGMVISKLEDNKYHHKIELSMKAFLNFYNDKNIYLKNEALSIIYHELYHVYNENILLASFIDNQINDEDFQYYHIGAEYWGEFFAYYKTRELHITDYPVKQFDKLYSSIRLNAENKDLVHRLFYLISNIIAYSLNNDSYLNKNGNTSFNYFKKDKNYDILCFELKNILFNYPNNLNMSDFINLGKVYCDLLHHFSYKICFNKKEMIITKFTLSDYAPV